MYLTVFDKGSKKHLYLFIVLIHPPELPENVTPVCWGGGFGKMSNLVYRDKSESLVLVNDL